MSQIGKAFTEGPQESAALQKLTSLVNSGMDFPDAEDRVRREYDLTNTQVQELRKRYDEDDFTQLIKNDPIVEFLNYRRKD
jgi:hypothetical protein